MGSAIKGLALGAGAGALWWAVEMAVQWGAGSLVPVGIAQDLLRWNLGVAALAGLVLGAFLLRRGLPVFALGLVGVYGFLRVYDPPGYGAEALFALLWVGGAALGTLLIGADGGLLAFLQVILWAAGAYSCVELAFNESHVAGLRGLWLPLTITAIPLAPLLLDRLLALVVRARPVRFGLEVVAAGIAAAWFAHPLNTTPFIDPTVTGVPPAEGTPDIYLVSWDTTRADHLSTYGYARETSPNLTRFAEDALVFERAHSTAGWTLPGHSSMLTGLYPSRHGAHAAGGWLSGQSVDGRRNVAYPLAEDKYTLAEALRDGGFNTGGFVANFSYLYRSFGFAQGFQVYDDSPWMVMRFQTPVMHLIHNLLPTYFTRPYRTAFDINHVALTWLDAAPAGRPAFIFMNYMDAHPPYLAPEPYTEWVKDLPFAKRLARKDLYTHEVRKLSDDEREYIAASYDGQLRAADEAFGKFIAGLKQRGRYDNALIIMTADHGTLLGEHDHVGHIGRMLYEPLLHIPLIVKFPGKDHPKGRIPTPVQNLDAFATALATAGIQVPAGTQGQAMPDVTHPTLAEEDVNAFLVWRYGKEYDRAIRVLVDGQWKYITTSAGQTMLFDVTRDPGELNNLATADPARATAMSQRLTSLLPFGPPPAPAGSGAGN